VHFAAGPWFTVQQPGEWKTVDTITVSDGDRTATAAVELQLEWPEEHE